MDTAYTTAGWRELYMFIGGAAAVLMGLVFVTLSLHLGFITQNSHWRGRARSGVFALMAMILISVFILIPDQPRSLLGAELLVFGVLSVLVPLRNQVRVIHAFGPRRSMLFPMALFDLSLVVTAFSGFSLIVGRFGGLYVLVLATVMDLMFVTLANWDLLVAVGEETRDRLSGELAA